MDVKNYRSTVIREIASLMNSYKNRQKIFKMIDNQINQYANNYYLDAMTLFKKIEEQVILKISYSIQFENFEYALSCLNENEIDIISKYINQEKDIFEISQEYQISVRNAQRKIVNIANKIILKLKRRINE